MSSPLAAHAAPMAADLRRELPHLAPAAIADRLRCIAGCTQQPDLQHLLTATAHHLDPGQDTP